MNKKYASLLSLVMVGGMLTGCSSNDLDVKKDVAVELGTPISTNIADYLSENINADEKNKILKEGKLSILEDKKVEGKEYQPIGEYTVKIDYGNKKGEVKVSVKDTTKPIFKDFNGNIDTYVNTKVDFSKMFTTEDLSNVTITGDDSKVDYTKEGSYKATVTATDEGQNVETKEVTVNVKKSEIKLDKSSKTMYEKESFVLKADVKGKETKATFKSSNDKVATVSVDGKVTAKKKGNAVITVEANGVKAECKVTVKAMPSGSSTTTETVKNPTTGKNETVTVVKPKPSRPSEPSKPVSSEPQLSRETFDLLNAERTKRGIPALQWSNDLAEKAKIRAKECTIEYSHVRPNGQLATSLGIDGEILTGGFSNSNAVYNWMSSSSHKESILRKEHTKCAVAKIKSPDTAGDIWVAVFLW